jgi:tRNA pseudouridine13 synthase
VEEVALYETQGDGQHLYVNLTKADLTTKEVQLQLERLFGLKRGDVGFAGMKDKHARTTQTFSLTVGHKSASFADEAGSRIQENLPVTVNWVAFHRNKLRPGHLLGNRFRITLVDLEVASVEALARSQAIVEKLRQRGLPNYFGPQRLGKGGANARAGLAILLGEQQKYDRWLRRFLVSSYQSYLCNRYLALRLERGLFDSLVAGDVAKKHATGGMFAVENVTEEQPRFAAQEISFTAPIFGPRMWEAQGDAGRFEAEILATSPATLEHFSRLSIDGTRRLGRLLVPDLAVALEGANLVVSFMLPKGAFATTLVRELTKVETDDAPAIEDEE